MAMHRDDQPKTPSPADAAPPAPEAQDPKKTKLARKAPAPTMLAPAEELPAAEPAPAQPAAAEKPDVKKTLLARKSSAPTMLAPAEELPQADSPPAAGPLPNLSLDEPAASEPADEAIDLVEVESVAEAGDEELEVLEAAADEAPNSDVLAAELLRDEKPASDVVDAEVIDSDVFVDELEEAAPASGIGPESPPPIEVEDVQADSDVSSHPDVVAPPASDVTQLGSDVLVAEPVPEEDAEERAHDILELVEGERSESGVVEMGSDVLIAESTAPSGASSGGRPREEAEVLEEIEAASPVSDVVELGSDAVLGEETPADQVPASGEQALEVVDEPLPESGVVLEEVHEADAAAEPVSAVEESLEEVSETAPEDADDEAVLEEVGEADDEAADAIEAQPASAEQVMEVDDAMFAAASDISARERASDIFSAEDEIPLPKPPKRIRPKSQLRAEKKTEEPLPLPEDDEHDVFSGETVTLDPGELKGKPPSSASEKVLEGDETIAPRGSSAVQWEEVKASSGVKETERTKAGANLEMTVPFQDPKKGKISSAARRKSDVQELVTVEDLGELGGDSATRSGVDPLAEALESGVSLDARKKAPAEEVEFEAEAAEESSAVNLGGPPAKKRKAKSGVVVSPELTEASTELDADAFADADEVLEVEEVAEVSEAEEAEALEVAEEAEEATELAEEDADAAVTEHMEADELIEAEADEAPMAPADRKRLTAARQAEAALFTEDVDAALEDAASAEEVFADVEAEEAEEAVEEAEEALDADADEAVEVAEADEELSDVAVADEFLEDDEEPLAVAAGKKKKKFPALMDEEDLTQPFEDDDADAAPISRKKKKRVWAEEDDEGGGVATLSRAPKPKYGRRWLGGTFLGILLAAGGAAGVWYFMPETLDEITEQSPNAKPRAVVVPGRGEKDFTELASARDEFKKKAEGLEGKLASEIADHEKTKASVTADVKKVEGERDAFKTNLDAANKQLAGVVTAMNTEKLWKDGEPKLFDDKKFKDSLDGLGKIRSDYASIVAKLDKFGGEKTAVEKVNALYELKAYRDEEIAVVNRVLKAAQTRDMLELAGRLLGMPFVIDPKEIDKKFTEEKIKEFAKLGDLAKSLAGAEETPADAMALAHLLNRRDYLARERDMLDGLIVDAYYTLVEGIVGPRGEPRDSLVKAARDARIKGESPLAVPLSSLASGVAGLPEGTNSALSKLVDYMKVKTALEFYNLREPLIVGPERKVDLHIFVLQDRDRSTPADLLIPTKEADFLLSKPEEYSAMVRAKAKYVLALAHRNREEYADAVKLLQEVKASLKGLKEPGLWSELALLSLRELTDPDSYYLRLARDRKAEADFKGALALIEAGFKPMPDNPHLFVNRAWTRVEWGYELLAASPDIRTDVGRAAKHEETAALAAYVLGLLEEKLDSRANRSRAKENYEKAIKLHKAEDDLELHALFLGALARVQRLADGFEYEPAPPPIKKGDKAPTKAPEEKKEPKDEGASLLSPMQTALFALLIVTLEPPFDDEDEPTKAKRLEHEAARATAELRIKAGKDLVAKGEEKLKEAKEKKDAKAELAAEKMIRAGEKIIGQGLMDRGAAETKLGHSNKGLLDYINGMKLFVGGGEGAELARIVDEHPAFGYPDSALRPNPYLALDHYGRGLHLYWARSYVEAEKHFFQSIYWFKNDARFHYFYGLSQLAQKTPKKRVDALYALETGSKLEAKNLPSSSVVNEDLERVQGDLRIYLNRYRLTALTGVDYVDGKDKKE